MGCGSYKYQLSVEATKKSSSEDQELPRAAQIREIGSNKANSDDFNLPEFSDDLHSNTNSDSLESEERRRRYYEDDPNLKKSNRSILNKYEPSAVIE